MANQPTKVRARYIVVTAIFVAAATPIGISIANTSAVTVTPVEGIAAFAILYVLAQAIERVNQLLVPLLDWALTSVGDQESATKNKQQALKLLRSERAMFLFSGTNATQAMADTAAEKEAAVTTADKEKALLTNALAFLLAMLAVGTFKFSLLASLGYTSVPSMVDLTITATAIMGGSAGLSDLISKVQKSKTASETGTT